MADSDERVGLSKGARWAMLAAGVVVLLVAFVALHGGGGDDRGGGAGASSTPPRTTSTQQPSSSASPSGEDRNQGSTEDSSASLPIASVPVLRVQGGSPVGGVKKLSFTKGDRIRFAVRSDSALPIHFHGYDIEKEAAPGKPARFDVGAQIEGRFEVEIESSGRQIADVEVNP
jgi:hypothetical protein